MPPPLEKAAQSSFDLVLDAKIDADMRQVRLATQMTLVPPIVLSALIYSAEANKHSQQQIALITTTVVLATSILMILLHWGGADYRKRLCQLMDLILIAFPLVVTVLRIMEVLGSADPAEISRSAAQALDAASSAIIFGRFTLGVLLATLSARLGVRMLLCAVLNAALSSPPVLVYLLYGSTEWLLAVMRLVTVPTLTGSTFAMLVQESLMRPAFERVRELELQQERLRQELVGRQAGGSGSGGSSDERPSSSTKDVGDDMIPAGLAASSASTSSLGSNGVDANSVSAPDTKLALPSVFDSLNSVREFQQHWEEVVELGQGAFSRAILIEHTKTKATAVKKQVYIGKASAESLVQLKREASTLASLEPHRHIIRYITCYLHGENMCIITDYASGGTLQRALNARKGVNGAPDRLIAPDIALTWTAQLCSAMHAIHAVKVLHRDVKPSNIFLNHKGQIRLGDFGLARQLLGSRSGRDTLAQTTCGTPYYMAPEQVTAQRYSYAADVWAYGCCVFEIFTLQRPFVGSSFPLLARIIVEGDTGMDARQAALLDACRRNTPPMPEAALGLVTNDGLFQRDASKRMTLVQVATVIAPLLHTADRRSTLHQILSSSAANEKTEFGEPGREEGDPLRRGPSPQM